LTAGTPCYRRVQPPGRTQSSHPQWVYVRHGRGHPRSNRGFIIFLVDVLCSCGRPVPRCSRPLATSPGKRSDLRWSPRTSRPGRGVLSVRETIDAQELMFCDSPRPTERLHSSIHDLAQGTGLVDSLRLHVVVSASRHQPGTVCLITMEKNRILDSCCTSTLCAFRGRRGG
jgi:hypothetical protein